MNRYKKIFTETEVLDYRHTWNSKNYKRQPSSQIIVKFLKDHKFKITKHSPPEQYLEIVSFLKDNNVKIRTTSYGEEFIFDFFSRFKR